MRELKIEREAVFAIRAIKRLRRKVSNAMIYTPTLYDSTKAVQRWYFRTFILSYFRTLVLSPSVLVLSYFHTFALSTFHFRTFIPSSFHPSLAIATRGTFLLSYFPRTNFHFPMFFFLFHTFVRSYFCAWTPPTRFLLSYSRTFVSGPRRPDFHFRTFVLSYFLKRFVTIVVRV